MPLNIEDHAELARWLVGHGRAPNVETVRCRTLHRGRVEQDRLGGGGWCAGLGGPCPGTPRCAEMGARASADEAAGQGRVAQ